MTCLSPTRYSVALLVLTALLSGSCTSPRPKYTKHYKSAAYDPPLSDEATLDNKPWVTFSAFVVRSSSDPQATGKLVTDLSDRAQARLVTEIARLIGPGAKPVDLAKALAEPIRRTAPAPEQIDLTRFRRKIVLSVDGRFWPPAYRMERNEFTLHLDNPAARFVGWDRIATEYDRVDLGDLTFSQQNKVTFGLELAPPQIQELTKATLGGETNRSLSEILELSRRYRVISGSLTPEKATLTRQGSIGIDLSGNTVVEVDLEVDGTPTALHVFSGLKAEEKFQPGERVRLARVEVRHPTSSCSPILSSVRLDYVLRTVLSGDSTYVESDDEVTFYRRYVNLAGPLEIIGSSDLRFAAFGLRSWRTQATVNIEATGSAETLHFRTYATAVEFLDWLTVRKGDRVGGRRLFIGDDEVRADTSLVELQVAPIKTNYSRC